MALSTLGTDPDYASLLTGNRDPRLLMAQKLMDLSDAPKVNASQSSFWANLLNQGGRGLLSGYLMNKAEGEAAAERTKQEKEAAAFAAELAGVRGGMKGAAVPAPVQEPPARAVQTCV